MLEDDDDDPSERSAEMKEIEARKLAEEEKLLQDMMEMDVKPGESVPFALRPRWAVGPPAARGRPAHSLQRCRLRVEHRA